MRDGGGREMGINKGEAKNRIKRVCTERKSETMQRERDGKGMKRKSGRARHRNGEYLRDETGE